MYCIQQVSASKGQQHWPVDLEFQVWSWTNSIFAWLCVLSLGVVVNFRDVGFFQLALLSVRLTDCAHEFGSSLCNAFIAHFEGVQFVL